MIQVPHHDVNKSQYLHSSLYNIADHSSQFLIVFFVYFCDAIKYQVIFLVDIKIKQLLLDFLK